jgi:hypothetical protein
MFGSLYFGQAPFGSVREDGTPTTRPECGGIFGSATFGQVAFGYHDQCGDEPVVVGSSAGGSMPKKRRKVYILPNERRQVQIEGIVMAFLHSQANSPVSYRN